MANNQECEAIVEIKSRIAAITNEKDESVLLAFIDIAKEKILRKAYPYSYSKDMEFPEKYENLLVEVAVYLLNKRGAEGETSHNENGIVRTYENADIPNSMFKSVIPEAGVL